MTLKRRIEKLKLKLADWIVGGPLRYVDELNASPTLERWSARIPLCATCGNRHNDSPRLQELFHTPRFCYMCGQEHRPVDWCPPKEELSK